jgi:hypothetical protein
MTNVVLEKAEQSRTGSGLDEPGMAEKGKTYALAMAAQVEGKHVAADASNEGNEWQSRLRPSSSSGSRLAGPWQD